MKFGKRDKSESSKPLPYPAPYPGSTIPDQRPKWLQEAENKKTKRKR